MFDPLDGHTVRLIQYRVAVLQFRYQLLPLLQGCRKLFAACKERHQLRPEIIAFGLNLGVLSKCEVLFNAQSFSFFAAACYKIVVWPTELSARFGELNARLLTLYCH